MAFTQPIPTELIRPHIEAYLREQGDIGHRGNARSDTNGYVEFGDEEECKFSVGMFILAEKAGLSDTTVGRILNGELETIEFDTADKLMCALNLVHLWHVEPLREHYLRGRRCKRGHNVDLDGAIYEYRGIQWCARCRKDAQKKSYQKVAA